MLSSAWAWILLSILGTSLWSLQPRVWGSPACISGARSNILFFNPAVSITRGALLYVSFPQYKNSGYTKRSHGLKSSEKSPKGKPEGITLLGKASNPAVPSSLHDLTPTQLITGSHPLAHYDAHIPSPGSMVSGLKLCLS